MSIFQSSVTLEVGTMTVVKILTQMVAEKKERKEDKEKN